MRFGIWGLAAGAALCVLNTAIAAEDVKQTILLLPDEAAECRYIASLAQQADAAFASAKSLRGVSGDGVALLTEPIEVGTQGVVREVLLPQTGR
jgi:hypothetical protein